MTPQLDLFKKESDEEFIARWNLLDTVSPYKSSGRLCYGLVSFRLSDLRKQGRHQEAAELAVEGDARVAWEDHWAKLYPFPEQS